MRITQSSDYICYSLPKNSPFLSWESTGCSNTVHETDSARQIFSRRCRTGPGLRTPSEGRAGGREGAAAAAVPAGQGQGMDQPACDKTACNKIIKKKKIKKICFCFFFFRLTLLDRNSTEEGAWPTWALPVRAAPCSSPRRGQARGRPAGLRLPSPTLMPAERALRALSFPPATSMPPPTPRRPPAPLGGPGPGPRPRPGPRPPTGTPPPGRLCGAAHTSRRRGAARRRGARREEARAARAAAGR